MSDRERREFVIKHTIEIAGITVVRVAIKTYTGAYCKSGNLRILFKNTKIKRGWLYVKFQNNLFHLYLTCLFLMWESKVDIKFFGEENSSKELIFAISTTVLIL